VGRRRDVEEEEEEEEGCWGRGMLVIFILFNHSIFLAISFLFFSFAFHWVVFFSSFGESGHLGDSIFGVSFG